MVGRGMVRLAASRASLIVSELLNVGAVVW